MWITNAQKFTDTNFTNWIGTIFDIDYFFTKFDSDESNEALLFVDSVLNQKKGQFLYLYSKLFAPCDVETWLATNNLLEKLRNKNATMNCLLKIPDNHLQVIGSSKELLKVVNCLLCNNVYVGEYLVYTRSWVIPVVLFHYFNQHQHTNSLRLINLNRTVQYSSEKNRLLICVGDCIELTSNDQKKVVFIPGMTSTDSSSDPPEPAAPPESKIPTAPPLPPDIYLLQNDAVLQGCLSSPKSSWSQQGERPFGRVSHGQGSVQPGQSNLSPGQGSVQQGQTSGPGQHGQGSVQQGQTSGSVQTPSSSLSSTTSSLRTSTPSSSLSARQVSGHVSPQTGLPQGEKPSGHMSRQERRQVSFSDHLYNHLPEEMYANTNETPTSEDMNIRTLLHKASTLQQENEQMRKRLDTLMKSRETSDTPFAA